MGNERFAASNEEVWRLTRYQRDMMIDHIDGEVAVNVRDPRLVSVRNSLLKIGMLKGATSGPRALRPRATVLTERGRMALAMVLGNYADALVRAGALDPMAILLQRKAAQTRPVSADVALEPTCLAMSALHK